MLNINNGEKMVTYLLFMIIFGIVYYGALIMFSLSDIKKYLKTIADKLEKKWYILF